MLVLIFGWSTLFTRAVLYVKEHTFLNTLLWNFKRKKNEIHRSWIEEKYALPMPCCWFWSSLSAPLPLSFLVSLLWCNDSDFPIPGVWAFMSTTLLFISFFYLFQNLYLITSIFLQWNYISAIDFLKVCSNKSVVRACSTSWSIHWENWEFYWRNIWWYQIKILE